MRLLNDTMHYGASIIYKYHIYIILRYDTIHYDEPKASHIADILTGFTSL
jgi:hypothetical protein